MVEHVSVEVVVVVVLVAGGVVSRFRDCFILVNHVFSHNTMPVISWIVERIPGKLFGMFKWSWRLMMCFRGKPVCRFSRLQEGPAPFPIQPFRIIARSHLGFDAFSACV